MAQLLHIPPHDSPALQQQIRSGLPGTLYEQVRDLLGLSQEQLARLLNISPRTLQRQRRQTIPPAVANRIYRILEVYDDALRISENNPEDAVRWLHTPLLTLGGARPVDLLDTEAGIHDVISLITGIEYGMPV